jgi:hypothetical protein
VPFVGITRQAGLALPAALELTNGDQQAYAFYRIDSAATGGCKSVDNAPD